MARPKFLFDSRFKDATPVASSTAAGDFAVANLTDFRPYTWWKPSAMPATVKIDSVVARPADYAFLYGHNLQDANACALIQGSIDDFASSIVTLAMSNAIAFPESFDNAKWSKENATITANSTAAPNKTLTAEKLVENTAVSVEHRVRQNIIGILPDNLDVEASVYLKAGERTWARLIFVKKDGTFPIANFDLANGAIGSLGGGVTASIESVGDGWYRCTVAMNMGSGATTPAFIINIAAGNNVVSYTGDGASGIYAWGAQMSKGSGSYEGVSGAPILLSWTQASHRYHRVNLINSTGTTAPSLAIAAIGAALESPVYFEDTFSPIDREPHGHTNRNEDGQVLGTIVNFESWEHEISLRQVDWSWARDTFMPAWLAHLRGSPFGFIWDSDLYPGDVRLVAREGDLSIPHRSGSLADVRFNVKGVAP